MTTDFDIRREAKEHGYRPENLEKVYRLLNLIETFMEIPYLRDRLVLKGGTALNLFHAERLPRLSVDIDFNYIGSLNREVMQQERIELESIIHDVCQRSGYELDRNPRAHAGGKMIWAYPSASGNKGRIEIDLNYLFRVPLWKPEVRESPNWPKQVKANVLNIHELAAGKLHALLGREASRDLFDSYHILTRNNLDEDKLRIAFTAYAAMERKNWQEIQFDESKFTVKEIRDRLIPVLQHDYMPPTSRIGLERWVDELVKGTKHSLSKVLPFKEREIEYLNLLQENGENKPELITNDNNLCAIIKNHPSILWRISQTKLISSQESLVENVISLFNTINQLKKDITANRLDILLAEKKLHDKLTHLQNRHKLYKEFRKKYPEIEKFTKKIKSQSYS